MPIHSCTVREDHKTPTLRIKHAIRGSSKKSCKRRHNLFTSEVRVLKNDHKQNRHNMHVCVKIMHVTYRSQKREDLECKGIGDGGRKIAQT